MSEHDTLALPATMPETPEERLARAEASEQAAWRAFGQLEELSRELLRRAEAASLAAENCARVIDELRLSGTRPRAASITSEIRSVTDQALQSIRAEAATFEQAVPKLSHRVGALQKENRWLTICGLSLIALIELLQLLRGLVH